MFKSFMKSVMFILAITMLMGVGTVVSAAERKTNITELFATNEKEVTINATDKVENVMVEKTGEKLEITPLWWPGDGPAPQVTKIECERYGWLKNGHWGVVLKVYGYGWDRTTFDGKKISWIREEPFIISGTCADGFYYLYDCGTITSAGNYPFNSTFTSTNFPYKKVTLNYMFTFNAK